MVHPKDLLDTIYLGDRACKSLVIDGWNNRVVLQVDEISRIRSSTGEWEFYTEEDITDGLIVFDNVDSIRFNPPGLLPNDLINLLEVEPAKLDGEELIARDLYLFKASVTSVGSEGYRGQVLIEIVAKSVHIEDPRRPGVEIKE